MSGLFTVNVSEARGFVAVPADVDALAVVMGCSSGGSDLSPFYLSASAAITGVGYGDAVDALTQIIEQAQPDGPAKKVPACLYTVPSTTTGSYGTIDVTGVTGTAVAAVNSGTHPYGTYEAYLKIVNGGFIGTDGITFQDSLDNGRSLSQVRSLGTATNYTIPHSNVRFDFSPSTADLTALNTLINEIYTDFNAHVILTAGTVHGVADNADVVSIASASDTATRIARINALRAAYILHIAKTAGGVHGAADTTNVLVAPVATDDSSALILALDIKAKYNLHRVLTSGGVHGAADSTNPVTSAAPVAGAFAAGDVIKVRTLAGIPAAADIDAAFTALALSTIDFGIVVCEWPMTAALLAHVTTGQAALRAAGKKATVLARTRIPDAGTNETDAAWNTSIAAAFAGYEDSTVCLRAAYEFVTDAVTGRQYLRSDLAQFAADVVRVDIEKLPDVPADRPMANCRLVDSSGNTIGHDEGPRGASTGLSNDTLDNRFSCAMRYPDQGRREEVFNTVPWVLYAADERIRNLPTRRIANAMERVAVTAGTSALGADLFYVPADPNNNASQNRLTAVSRAAIHGKIFRALKTAFRGKISNADAAGLDTGLVQVNPVVTVSGGNLLGISVTLAPIVKGYLLSISFVLAIQE